MFCSDLMRPQSSDEYVLVGLVVCAHVHLGRNEQYAMDTGNASAGVWTSLSDTSTAKPLEAAKEDRPCQLVVELHTEDGLQAKGVSSIDSLWQVRTSVSPSKAEFLNKSRASGLQ